MTHILVCDDEQSLVDHWKRVLESSGLLPDGWTVRTLSGDKLGSEVIRLRERRSKARNNEPFELGDLLFDQADLLFVDFDLERMKSGAVLDGERLARLLRWFSTAGPIVGVNRFGDNPFDLTLQAGLGSYADVNIGSSQLTNPGLWRTDWVNFRGWEGFRPWSWPILPDLVSRFRKMVEDSERNLAAPVLELVGLPASLHTSLTSDSIEMLGGGLAAEDITVEAVVESARSREGRKDRTISSLTGRIAAARISGWLERMVLPGQDLLVDAPHLVSRFGSLAPAAGSPEDLWRATSLDPVGTDLLGSTPDPASRYSTPHWVSRQVWFWEVCQRDKAISEVAKPFGHHKALDAVFCEDTSSFVPKNEAREFNISFATPFVRRFVVGPKSPDARFTALGTVNYTPASRLL